MLRITLKKVVPDIHRAAVFARSAFVFVLLVTVPRIASADVVTDWNIVCRARRAAIRRPAAAGARPGDGPDRGPRRAQRDQSALRRAIPAIGPADPGASPDAAVAAAARQTLLELLAPLPDSPAKQAAIQTDRGRLRRNRRHRLRTSPATQAGIDVGEEAAEAILALRVNDGSDTPNLPLHAAPGTRRLSTHAEPGVPRRGHAVVCGGWRYVTPLCSVNHGRQFEVEPGAIFDLAGADYTREYNEVKQIGDARVRGAAARLRGERHRALLAGRRLELELDDPR